MESLCRARDIRIFPPIPRRMSYMSMSMAGQDYQPVVDVIRKILTDQRGDLGGATA